MNTYAGLLLPLTLTIPALTALAEDTLRLKDGSLLRGSVRSIEANGNIIVETGFTTKPVRVLGEALHSINFEVAKGKQTSHPQLLHLINGDTLPATVSGLDAEAVQIQTWYAGEIRIPRKFIASVDYGVTPQKLLYNGPQGLADWVNNDGWELENGKLVCGTSGTIGRPNILPERFILRIRIEWENSPNIRLYFCDDHLKRQGKANRYYFELNSAGLLLRREVAEGERRWFMIASSLRRPAEFKDEGFDLEIRVDRQNRLLSLYIDGEKVGRYTDPVDDFPTGKGIMLQSRAGGNMKNIVPLIQIHEWDAVSHLRSTEGHHDSKTDAIVDIDGKDLRGEVQSVVQEDGKDSVILKRPSAPDLLQIRTERISILYFKTVGEHRKDSSRINFAFSDGGKLRLSTLALVDETLSAEHPLLGELKLSREALQELSILSVDEEGDSDPE